jgi:acid phosphatase
MMQSVVAAASGAFLCAGMAHAGANGIPTPTKVVVVIEENHSYADIISAANVPLASTPAPYINELARGGANFTNATEIISNPSQPNYIAFFSGGSQGINSNTRSTWVYDPVGHPTQPTNLLSATSLGGQLKAAGKTFIGYSQSLNADGSDLDGSDAAVDHNYARKHNPWTQFADMTTTVGGIPNNIATNKVFNSTNFPTADGTDYSFLPSVSFIVPDLQNDMHDGSILKGDTWLKTNLSEYVEWAQSNNSLLIVTFDEGNTSSGDPKNPLLFYGPMVKTGDISTAVNNYAVLRMIEDMHSLSYLGGAATAPNLAAAFVPEPGMAACLCFAAGALLRRYRSSPASRA